MQLNNKRDHTGLTQWLGYCGTTKQTAFQNVGTCQVAVVDFSARKNYTQMGLPYRYIFNVFVADFTQQ